MSRRQELFLADKRYVRRLADAYPINLRPHCKHLSEQLRRSVKLKAWLARRRMIAFEAADRLAIELRWYAHRRHDAVSDQLIPFGELRRSEQGSRSRTIAGQAGKYRNRLSRDVRDKTGQEIGSRWRGCW